MLMSMIVIVGGIIKIPSFKWCCLKLIFCMEVKFEPLVLKYIFDAFILVFLDFFPVQIVKWRGLGNLNDWSFSLPDAMRYLTTGQWPL